MKKAFVYILLVLYVAVQLKPLTVIVQDVLAHSFFRVQHMATIHYENGRYHLHTELEAISRDDTGMAKEKTPVSQKANEISSQELSRELNFDITLNATHIPAPAEVLSQLPAGHTSICLLPPEQA